MLLQHIPDNWYKMCK